MAHPLSSPPVSVLASVRPRADVRVLAPKGLNTSAYLDLNHFARHTAWAHGFMHIYALWLGPGLMVALFVAAYAVTWWRRAPRASALLVLGAMGTVASLGLNQLVGHAAKELRPYVTHPGALVLVGKANDYSFPSDHSVIAGGVTMSLLLLLGREAWRRGKAPGEAEVEVREGSGRAAIRALVAAAAVLGLFLCFARVYVGAHYPGDVVAGFLLASLVVVVVSLAKSLAYLGVDRVEPTVLGTLLRRPLPASNG